MSASAAGASRAAWAGGELLADGPIHQFRAGDAGMPTGPWLLVGFLPPTIRPRSGRKYQAVSAPDDRPDRVKW